MAATETDTAAAAVTAGDRAALGCGGCLLLALAAALLGWCGGGGGDSGTDSGRARERERAADDATRAWESDAPLGGVLAYVCWADATDGTGGPRLLYWQLDLGRKAGDTRPAMSGPDGLPAAWRAHLDALGVRHRRAECRELATHLPGRVSVPGRPAGGGSVTWERRMMLAGLLRERGWDLPGRGLERALERHAQELEGRELAARYRARPLLPHRWTLPDGSETSWRGDTRTPELLREQEELERLLESSP